MAVSAIPGTSAILVYNVNLNGTQSGTGSPATGTATVTVDDILNSVGVSLSFSGLTGGPATAAHIHCCVAPGANGPVVIPFTGFPNATSGTYSNTFTGISAANIAGIEAGQSYINIHDATFPGGEIRGQITPEPATLASLGLGMAVLLGARARRKRQAA